MGRELKRVPMDFEWPMGERWPGYCFSTCSEDCDACKRFAALIGVKTAEPHGCPSFRGFLHDHGVSFDPPEGEGYQLWETTTEGSPQSPVFETLEALCEWCEVNATTFADCKATKEQWFQMLSDNFVHHTEGPFTFL